ncbi:MAG: amylo-alpha-1,6-glucosidase [Caulobacteraceae bacterium]|nr:amylo-alpha-1,6-glucosidase [Caulobacteraceae bacterium]
MDDLAPSPQAEAETGETAEPRVPHRLFALKDADTFLVADAYGDVLGAADGLFRDDTRVLSRFRLLVGGASPSLLSSAVSQDNVYFTSNTTNRPLPFTGGRATPHGVIHLERKRFLWDGRLYERICCTNYGRDEVMAPVSIEYGADFRDMFEVRGQHRPKRGRVFPPEIDGRRTVFRYEGLDGVVRASVIAFSDPPGRMSGARADFLFHLPPEQTVEFYVEVGEREDETPTRARFRAAAARSRLVMRHKIRQGARLKSSGRLFNEWMDRSRSDLALLTTNLATGPYPYAGIPWFSTTFGRDAVITAWQALWLEPALARGVLAFLADNQATEVSAFRDSAPGKILHEARRGEMTTLGELPFGRYYGGVDTTPLFVALAGAYAERTGDMAFIDRLWPALEAAAGWMDAFGDSNGDGLIDYARGADTGLSNQGWKDSEDSVFHKDGRFPEGPIALVEVQGYAFAAYRALAGLAARRGGQAAAERWLRRAEQVREAVEQRFWMEEDGFYGIAIDGRGRLCRVRASNPGHLLFAGLPSAERARAVGRALLSTGFSSGWGMRTLAVGEARFNPMSYHNGSVWPHDTAICAAGMARYGERDGVVRMLSALFETAVHFEMRLPELFCGFPRQPGEPPVAYPVACIPQAWAAGAVFMVLQACLGVTIDAWRREVRVDHPRLPIGVDHLAIEGLTVAGARVDLVFEHVGDQVIVMPGRASDPDIAIVTRR